MPKFREYRFPGNSRQIPFPVKNFWVFSNPAPYFGQIPDPKIPFKTSLCLELLRAMQKGKKKKN